MTRTTTTEFAKLLDALGRDPEERLSINDMRDGRFTSRILTVAECTRRNVPDDKDYWYGTGVLHECVTEGRGSAADVTGIREVFSDLDIKPGGLPSWEVAHEVIATLAAMLGTGPVAVVDSGHGLQPHWPIERSEATDWPDEHDLRWSNAMVLYRRWGRLVASVAERYGGKVDNVYDLSRVLRVPGTVNTKEDPPVSVTAEWSDASPVSLERLAETLDEYGVEELPGDREVLGEIVAPPTDWVHGGTTCGYVARMTAGWLTDTPDKGRHPWLMSQAVRLACTQRLGCITADDHIEAVRLLAERFAWLVANTEPYREIQPGEIGDALSWGITKTATLPQERAQEELGHHRHPDPQSNGSRASGVTPEGHQIVVAPTGDGILPDGYRATDTGNAGRFLELAKGRVRYVHAWGRWLVYRSGRWIVDDNDVLVTELGKQVGRELFRVAAGVEGDKDLRERTWKWALRCEQSSVIAAMVRLARGGDGILVDHEQLDANPHLLNCLNGTIDLRTGMLQPHDPDDLITWQCPVAYDPSAHSELWNACLRRWQPEEAMRDYLRIRAGASATGLYTETLDVDWGDGANGKSKFHGILEYVMGPYAVTPHKSLLTVQRHEQHPTEIAALFRKRMAVAPETSAGAALDDEQIKYLTGGDRLKGRRMREDPWEFQPSHTLIMHSNHKPAIRGRDFGIWRRVRLVPWTATIPLDEQDTRLGSKLEVEAPAVLAWMVEGARRFLAEGLIPPEQIRAATEEYRADEDVVGRFISEVMKVGEGFSYMSDIKLELEQWCDEQDVPQPRLNEIADAFRQRGARDGGRKQYKGKRSTIWNGIMIREGGR